MLIKKSEITLEITPHYRSGGRRHGSCAVFRGCLTLSAELAKSNLTNGNAWGSVYRKIACVFVILLQNPMNNQKTFRFHRGKNNNADIYKKDRCPFHPPPPQPDPYMTRKIQCVYVFLDGGIQRSDVAKIFLWLIK